MELKLKQTLQLQRPELAFDLSSTIPPEEMARRIKLVFKQMPEGTALIVFAKVMTSDVPHEMKVAVWDAVRYSHIWWHVDEVLKGDVMENPIVQCAFADAVAMRCWRVVNQKPGWSYTQRATRQAYSLAPHEILMNLPEDELPLQWFLWYGTCGGDGHIAECLSKILASGEFPRLAENFVTFEDFNGNNLLWYLTYRDDQQAEGGFACPKLAKTLIDLGVDPNHRNKLGLSWNDVACHVNRQGAGRSIFVPSGE